MPRSSGLAPAILVADKTATKSCNCATCNRARRFRIALGIRLPLNEERHAEEQPVAQASANSGTTLLFAPTGPANTASGTSPFPPPPGFCSGARSGGASRIERTERAHRRHLLDGSDASGCPQNRRVGSRRSGTESLGRCTVFQLDPQQAPETTATTSAPSSRATWSTPPAPRLASAPSNGGTGAYVVQLSSQKSESEAQASFRALQAKYPSALSDRSPIIRRADLGAKGVFDRVLRVGSLARRVKPALSATASRLPAASA